MACRYGNAQKSLSLNGMYEGAGILHWFDLKLTTWRGHSLQQPSVTYTQLVAARTLFFAEHIDCVCS